MSSAPLYQYHPITNRHTREILHEIHLGIHKNYPPLLLALKEGELKLRKVKEEIVEQLIQIYGYPLENKIEYVLKVWRSDYFFSVNSHPLLEIAKLKIPNLTPAFHLIDRSSSTKVLFIYFHSKIFFNLQNRVGKENSCSNYLSSQEADSPFLELLCW